MQDFPLSRRTFLAAAGLAALPAVALPVLAAGEAASYPSKPVRIVVPYAAGGSADKLTRMLAERLAVLWGQAVVVENIQGANGTIGAARVAKLPPDGYTLLEQGENITLNAILQPQVPFEIEKAFAPVIKAVVNPQVLAVFPGSGITSFAAYLERARSHPDTVSVALGGNGGIAHVAHALLTQMTGARANYIFYSGGAPAIADTMAGHTTAVLVTLAAATEQIRAGRLRALSVTTSYRSQALPDVPSMADQVPDFAVESWQGFFAPAGTPPEVVAKIHRDASQVLQSAEMRMRLEDMGFRIAGGGPDELASTLRQELPRYTQAIRGAGISVKLPG